MELFRVTKTEYQQDLSGIGAFYYGGRWNSPNHHMLYTSSHRSLAMLETLVHMHRTMPPADYVVVVLFVPDATVTASTLYTVPDWQEDLHWSKTTGDDWIKSGSTLLLKVPSVVVKSEYNYLVNPLHPATASIKVMDVEPFHFDKRLFRK